MSPTLQRTIPVLISISIILLVAVLRDRSRTFAAIVVTMPVNVALGLWLVASNPNSSQQSLVDFSQAILINLIPTFFFLIVVWLATRQGWTFFPAVAAGYATWAVVLIALLWFQSKMG